MINFPPGVVSRRVFHAVFLPLFRDIATVSVYAILGSKAKQESEKDCRPEYLSDIIETASELQMLQTV